MYIQPILAFLKELDNNNNKVWMDANKLMYQTARTSLIAIADFLIRKIATFDTGIASLLPKDVIFRINRDTRFSKDKTVYKTYMGLFLANGGKKSEYAGYYLHLAPNNQSFIGGGMYQPPTTLLNKVRQEIDYNGNHLERIVLDPSFQAFFKNLQGEKLQKPPKGYTAAHPHIAWLKHKSFIVTRPIKDQQACKLDFLDEVLTTFKAVYPLNNFLNSALEN